MKIVYGIKNCNTVKKATDWLESKAIPFTFHNFKTAGIQAETLTNWCNQVGWEKLVNKKSATWRGLSKEVQESINSSETAIAILVNHTSLIKRPVIEDAGKVVSVGFDESAFANTFK